MMPSPTSQSLLSVYGNSAGDVYAAGAAGTVLHFNGGTWAALPSLPADLDITALWANTPTEIFVVGRLTTYANTGDRFYRWDGTSWELNDRGANTFSHVVQYNTASTGIPGDRANDVAYDAARDLFWVALEDFGLASVDVDASVWTGYSAATGLVSNLASRST